MAEVVVGDLCAAPSVAGSDGAVAGSMAALRAAEDVLDRLLASAPTLAAELVQTELAPLVELRPVKRLKLALELDSLLAGVPAHRRAGVAEGTVRSRRQRLREWFGAALDDPDARLRLCLALRWVLHRWRAEAAYEERQRSRRQRQTASRVRGTDDTSEVSFDALQSGLSLPAQRCVNTPGSEVQQ